MIPISDINPAKNTPYVTRVFILFTAAVYLLVQPKTSSDLFNFFYEFFVFEYNIYYKKSTQYKIL